MNIIELTTFFGWCSVINVSILLLTTVTLTLGREWIINIHHQMAGVKKAALPALYFQYLGQYKIFVIIFNIVPYLALRIILN
jgi:hypothetical protein